MWRGLFVLFLGAVLGGGGMLMASRVPTLEPMIETAVAKVYPAEYPVPEGGTRLSLQVLDQLSVSPCYARDPDLAYNPPEWMERAALGPLTSTKQPQRTVPDLQSYPGIVKIEQILSSSGSQRHHCAGTRIAKNWVMTANHCIQMRGPAVHVYDMLIVSPKPDVAVAETHISPVTAALCQSSWYSPTGKFDDDIALIYVEDTRALEGVPIATLDSARAPLSSEHYQTAWFGGWGKNGENRFFQGGRLNIETIGELFLLGNNGGEFAPCVGDSGGPLYVQTRYGPRVVGVLSAVTDDSCPPYDKAFYVRVKTFGDWISKTMRNCLQDGRFVCRGNDITEQGA